ncbi:hypothetical protein P7K49_019256 [Saguinus oedipus]|uniref:Uncharacterized protein n=1 Tax=Saguinus oedipus TaxID=9490 RepID=A0ABQ9UXN7_SAGOE|nr:hypothetical protein P7K49_019256 [Saguinus oedipus]
MKACYIVPNLPSRVTSDVSSTSKNDGSPEDMDKDKHDDSTDDSDIDRSLGECEGGEFVQHADCERDHSEGKKTGRKKEYEGADSSSSHAVSYGRSGNPEEEQKVEEFSGDDDQHNSDDSEAENHHKNSIKRSLISMGHLLLLHRSRLLPTPSLFLLLRYKHFPCQDHLLLDFHLLHHYSLLGHLWAFLLDHLQELLHS